MPPLINSLSLNEFFYGTPAGSGVNLNIPSSPLGKTIQKSYRFFVTFFPNFLLMKQRPDIFKEIGPPPIIRSFHVQSITIPQYTFGKETQYYGTAPRSFPILKHDGFEVTINFEEDEKGTIGFFISWMQRLAIEPNLGLYTPPDFVKLPMIGIVTENDIGVPVCAYTLHDAFYLSSSGAELDYGTSTSIKYSIVFNVDIINSFYPQAAMFNTITNAITGAILG